MRFDKSNLKGQGKARIFILKCFIMILAYPLSQPEESLLRSQTGMHYLAKLSFETKNYAARNRILSLRNAYTANVACEQALIFVVITDVARAAKPRVISAR